MRSQLHTADISIDRSSGTIKGMIRQYVMLMFTLPYWLNTIFQNVQATSCPGRPHRGSCHRCPDNSLLQTDTLIFSPLCNYPPSDDYIYLFI